MVKRGVALVPEGRHVFSELTVRENLDLGAYYRTDKQAVAEISSGCSKLSRSFVSGCAFPGGSLSGGQQQMLAIGRAMMSRPRLLMLAATGSVWMR